MKSKKSYADECLERAEKFPFHSSHYGHDTITTAQACEAELDHVYSIMVPELARRLKRACEELRLTSIQLRRDGRYSDANELNRIADELEAPLEGEVK